MSEEYQEIKRYPVKQSASFATGAALTMGLIDVLAHMGPTGLLLSGLAGYVAWRHGPEVYEHIEQQVRGIIPPHQDQKPEQQAEPGTKKGRSLWQRAMGHHPDLDDQVQARDVAQQAEPGNSIDALFKTEQEAEVTTVPRLLPNDIIRNTPSNCYRVCIGRSLTRPDNRPVWINFYKQHLKLIGASQYGKSSMAAALLYLITRTHDSNHVLVSLLDMEYKTSKLFEDIPHLAEVTINGKPIILHAKTREQVLEHLRYILAIMNDRYTMSEAEIEQEAILLVYLEEFLALKDYFKRLIDATTGEAKEQAKKDYAQLVYCVSEIARRGLKVKIQLLMCAQVDYRDEDFQEALINVTAGMAFCVRPTAAAAAGFYASDLLKRNVEEDKKGQAVVETPDCKDLVLAPDYDLRKKLLAFEKARQAEQPAGPKRPSMLAPAGSSNNQDNEDAQAREAWRRIARESEQPVPAHQPEQNLQAQLQEQNQRKLTSLHRQALEHWQPGMSYRDLGEKINVGKDKAGDLIKDLKKWGFIRDDGSNE